MPTHLLPLSFLFLVSSSLGCARHEVQTTPPPQAPAFSDLELIEEVAPGSLLAVTAPAGLDWELRFPTWGLPAIAGSRTPDDAQIRYFFSMGKYSVSLHIDESDHCDSGETCRDAYMAHPSALGAYTNIQTRSIGPFAAVTYITETSREAAGLPPGSGKGMVRMLHLNGFLARDGRWVDVHLSAATPESGDLQVLASILNSITLEDKPSVSREMLIDLSPYARLGYTLPAEWTGGLESSEPPGVFLHHRNGEALQMMLMPFPVDEEKINTMLLATFSGSAESFGATSEAPVFEALGGGPGMHYMVIDPERVGQEREVGNFLTATTGVRAVGAYGMLYTFYTYEEDAAAIESALDIVRSVKIVVP